ncbi:MAG: NfeD family protein [Treponema sp.]|jgi:membrane protein implicated in regulation of membrane protease activity|nr:NfeD family protein [Treponema sp.]
MTALFSVAGTPWFWLALAVLLALVELVTAFTLTTIWFAIAAFVMMIVSGVSFAAGRPMYLAAQWGIFFALSALLLIFTRPFALKRLKVGSVKTNVDDLIGRDAIALQKISVFGKGEIKVKGQVWTAAPDAGEAADIEKNAICVIVRIEGVKAIVKKKE